MSDKRFTTKNIICSNYCVWDNNDKPYGNDEVADLLNEQQARIELLEDDLLAMNMTNGNLEGMLKVAKEENEELLQQLQCNKMSKSVCSVCKNHRLEQVSDNYYVSKCEKGHNECSKTMLRCCEDFEVLNDE